MRITDSKDENRWAPSSEVDTDLMVRDGARVILIEHDQTYTLSYFERRIEPYGVVRVVTTPQGLEIWVGGEQRYTRPRT